MTLTEVKSDRTEGLEAKIDRLTEQVSVLTAEAEERARQRELLSGLVEDVVPLGPDALALVTDRLAEAEQRGYFAFARAGAGMADRVITSFDEDDLEQLGDNIVTILQTVKEITQPEMLALLSHMVEAVQSQQRYVEAEPDRAPSLWDLAKQVRDPDVRRGLARAIGTLRAVSVETGPEPPSQSTHPEGER